MIKKLIFLFLCIPLFLISQSSMNMNLLGEYNFTSEASDIWGWYNPRGICMQIWVLDT